jgi:fluoride exporter
VTGAALLGLLVGLALSDDAFLIAGTATVGSYTTFSTWMLESLSEDGEGKWGAANLLVSLGGGLAAAAAGRALGAHL